VARIARTRLAIVLWFLDELIRRAIIPKVIDNIVANAMNKTMGLLSG
jgi:hypothetical protein